MNKQIMHYMYDGYNINNPYMSNIDYFTKAMTYINEKFIMGKVTIIPYFHGKIEEDRGITGCIIGNGKHFTCHTFCYHETVYIDYCSKENKSKKSIEKEVKKIFKTGEYNEILVMETSKKHSKIKEKFGKHIIVKVENNINIEDAESIINSLLKLTKMTAIHDMIVNKYKGGYDLIQLIAESHISCHAIDKTVYFDIFSCKDYNSNHIKTIFKNYSYTLIEVIRGK